jgi:hypothetical protein
VFGYNIPEMDAHPEFNRCSGSRLRLR